ncbi:MAG: helix-turn-helix domain-containing protein [Kofleriaceae bacterium]
MSRLRYADAAAYLGGLPHGTLRSMVSRGQVPHIRLGPATVVFDTEDLDRWLDERRVAAAPRATFPKKRVRLALVASDDEGGAA